MDIDLPPPQVAVTVPEGQTRSSGVDPQTAIDGDLACIRCQYNLRGLRGDWRCPECGLAVLSTLRKNVVLSQTDLRWLETLRRGAYVLAASMIVWAVAPFALLQTEMRGHVVAPLVLVGPRAWAVPFAWRLRVGGLDDPILLAGLAALVLYTVGIWHVAAQEPALRVTERALTPRKVLVALAITVPVAASGWWNFVRGAQGDRYWPVWAGAFAILDCVVHVLLFMHLRHLASRVLDAALLRETRFLGAAQTTSLMVIAAGCGLAAADAGFEGFEGLIVLGCVGLSLAGIGAAALMFAFVRAFGQSAAAARAGDETPYTLAAAAATRD